MIERINIYPIYFGLCISFIILNTFIFINNILYHTYSKKNLFILKNHYIVSIVNILELILYPIILIINYVPGKLNIVYSCLWVFSGDNKLDKKFFDDLEISETISSRLVYLIFIFCLIWNILFDCVKFVNCFEKKKVQKSYYCCDSNSDNDI